MCHLICEVLKDTHCDRTVDGQTGDIVNNGKDSETADIVNNGQDSQAGDIVNNEQDRFQYTCALLLLAGTK